MKKLLKTFVVIGSILYLGNTTGAILHPPFSESPSFENCFSVWDVVGDFCDAQTLANLALVSSTVAVAPKKQLDALKEWRDKGGLLVAMFGSPSEDDKESYYRLRRTDSDLGNLSADEIKRALLSFAHIADPCVVAELSDAVDRYIEGRYELSARAKYQLKMLLPNSNNGHMAQLLSDRDDIGNWLDGDSLELSSVDQRKIFVRILMQPLEVSEYSCEINNVSSYLWRTNATNARYARLYIKSRLEAKELRLSDLCLLQCYCQMFGCWDESDIAMTRMMEHPEMKGWLKIYCILIAKPWADNVIKPVMQYYTTLSWLGRKALKALNK